MWTVVKATAHPARSFAMPAEVVFWSEVCRAGFKYGEPVRQRDGL